MRINPFLPGSTRLILGSILALAALCPCQAVPPTRQPAVNTHQAARCQAQEAQRQFHLQQRAKARKAPAAPGWFEHGPPRLTSILKFGVVAALLASQGQVLGAAAQAPALPNPLTVMPNLNLSATDPTTVFVAQSVHLALGRANGTGALPSMAELNDLLARNSPTGFSVLQTLPAVTPSSATATSASSSLDEGEPSPDSVRQVPFLFNTPDTYGGTTASDDLATAQTNLNVAQLTNVFYLLEAIGEQLLGDAALATSTPLVAEALEFAGFNLASIGFGFAFSASQVTTVAAQARVTALENAQQKALQAQADQERGGGAAVDPNVVYGTWQRLENDQSGQTILYKIYHQELVKINSTLLDDGDENTEIEATPGTVTCQISYRHPAGQLSASAATGRINVRLVIAQDGARPIELKFWYLRATGGTVERDPAKSFDVLVEQTGERKIYVKVSEY